MRGGPWWKVSGTGCSRPSFMLSFPLALRAVAHSLHFFLEPEFGRSRPDCPPHPVALCRGQHACCGHRLYKGACVPAHHLPLCPVVFYFRCCKNITFDLSLWLLKKEETTNRLGFHFSPPLLPLTSSSLLFSPSLHFLLAHPRLPGAPAS